MYIHLSCELPFERVAALPLARFPHKPLLEMGASQVCSADESVFPGDLKLTGVS
jgi:hypothetical protein